MKHYLAILIISCALPASALTLNGGVDCSVEIEQPKMEFTTPVVNVQPAESEAVDFSGNEQNINIKDARKRVDNDILDRGPNTSGFYYNNGQVEYIGVKVNKKGGFSAE